MKPANIRRENEEELKHAEDLQDDCCRRLLSVDPGVEPAELSKNIVLLQVENT